MWMFVAKKRINVNVKLLAGLDQREGYDPEEGIALELSKGFKLKKVVKLLGLPGHEPIAFIINGEKANPGSRLHDGDEVFCFLPFAGG